MKYWRGYLVAGILAACTWALEKFASTHAALVDMFYPYVTRLAQSFLAQWSMGAGFCLWQILLVTLIVLGLATAVLMILFKWNPIQWFGWVLAVAAVIGLLNTGIYGLNRYAGPLAEDMRLPQADYTIKELQEAAEYYRNEANRLALKIPRDEQGNPAIPPFEELAEQAGQGFRVLTTQEFYSVFAGSVEPVKKLGWSSYYTGKGIGGKLMPLTGEAAVNPQAPGVYLPYGMCEQMARRMSIAVDSDAQFAGILACRFNPEPLFQYAGSLMAYHYCEQTLDAILESTGDPTVADVKAGVNERLAADLETYRAFFGSRFRDSKTTDLLVSWHIQQIVLPLHQEEEKTFDPLDENQVDLSGLVNAPTQSAEEE